MPKNLILCFDGTGNEPEDAHQQRNILGDVEDDGVSNVFKLHLLLGGDLHDGTRFPGKQLSIYHSGVGTYGSKAKRAFNAALAPDNLDVGRIIRMGVRDVEKHYEPGDRLFVFGFSRGAAIARRFCAVLGDHLQAPPRVRFLGVFDTVASIGKPNLKDDQRPISDVLFENGSISERIDEALHLLSIDDRRKAFFPILMNKDDRATEVWFAGAHSDIGGGYYRDGLSDITLQFLLEEFETRGLGLEVLAPGDIAYDKLDPKGEDIGIDLDDLVIEPDALGVCHMQERSKLATRVTLGPRHVRVNVKDKASLRDTPLIHVTVAQRVHGDASYRPRALKGRPHAILQDDGVTSGRYAGLGELLVLGAPERLTLEVGDSKVFTVVAHRKVNYSGLFVEAGQSYRFEIRTGQTWKDASIECGPEGWNRSRLRHGLKRLFIKRKESERRCPEANWFEMIGCVGSDDAEVFRMLKHSTRADAYTIRSTGELGAFANDLHSRFGNNTGRIEVKVHRTS